MNSIHRALLGLTLITFLSANTGLAAGPKGATAREVRVAAAHEVLKNKLANKQPIDMTGMNPGERARLETAMNGKLETVLKSETLINELLKYDAKMYQRGVEEMKAEPNKGMPQSLKDMREALNKATGGDADLMARDGARFSTLESKDEFAKVAQMSPKVLAEFTAPEGILAKMNESADKDSVTGKTDRAKMLTLLATASGSPLEAEGLRVAKASAGSPEVFGDISSLLFNEKNSADGKSVMEGLYLTAQIGSVGIMKNAEAKAKAEESLAFDLALRGSPELAAKMASGMTREAAVEQLAAEVKEGKHPQLQTALKATQENIAKAKRALEELKLRDLGKEGERVMNIIAYLKAAGGVFDEPVKGESKESRWQKFKNALGALACFLKGAGCTSTACRATATAVLTGVFFGSQAGAAEMPPMKTAADCAKLDLVETRDPSDQHVSFCSVPDVTLYEKVSAVAGSTPHNTPTTATPAAKKPAAHKGGNDEDAQ